MIKLELHKDWYFFVLENDDVTWKPRIRDVNIIYLNFGERYEFMIDQQTIQGIFKNVGNSHEHYWSLMADILSNLLRCNLGKLSITSTETRAILEQATPCGWHKLHKSRQNNK